MSTPEQLKQEIDQLQMEVADLNKQAMKVGGIACLTMIILLVAVYLIFSNLFTMFEDGGGKVAVGFGLLVIVGVISIILRRKQSKATRELIVMKTKALAAKKEELEKLQSSDIPGGEL